MIYAGGAAESVTIGDTSQHDLIARNLVRQAMRDEAEAATTTAGGTFDGPAWDAAWDAALDRMVCVSFPANDDPDITPQGWQVKVDETLNSGAGRVYYIEPSLVVLAQTVPCLNLADVESPGDPHIPGAVFAKGQPGGVAALDADGDVNDAAGQKVGVGGYSPPAGGIPETDLAAAVQTKLNAPVDQVARDAAASKATAAEAATAAPVQSVAGRTGAVTVTSTDLTDSTATGRAVVTATSQTAARTALGAGTSNLAIGTTSTTAAAGNDSSLSDTRAPHRRHRHQREGGDQRRRVAGQDPPQRHPPRHDFGRADEADGRGDRCRPRTPPTRSSATGARTPGTSPWTRRPTARRDWPCPPPSGPSWPASPPSPRRARTRT